VFGNVDPRRGTMMVDGPLDILDHSSASFGYGSKIGIDATRKWKSEGYPREWPEEIIMSEDVKERVSRRWSEYGLPGKAAIVKRQNAQAAPVLTQ